MRKFNFLDKDFVWKDCNQLKLNGKALSAPCKRNIEWNSQKVIFANISSFRSSDEFKFGKEG